MNRTQNYIALDLELNNADDGSTPNPKIIQVGIAIGSYNDYLEGNIRKQRWYIDPQEPIFPFITQLTGITDQDIAEHAVPHEQVAIELAETIKNHHCFVNPVTWGGGDSRELKDEFKERNITFPCFGHRWIDVKTWYVLSKFARGLEARGGLKSAMHDYKLKFEGDPHRADVDAYNTLRLFFKVLEMQKKLFDTIELAKGIQ
jgi:inhibitor of KinA sporulation pathway (predicted exonuclease)